MAKISPWQLDVNQAISGRSLEEGEPLLTSSAQLGHEALHKLKKLKTCTTCGNTWRVWQAVQGFGHPFQEQISQPQTPETPYPESTPMKEPNCQVS